MRELVMWNLVTLDGFFEGPRKWDLAFHEYVWGEELERFSIEQSKSIGALVFGRVTYEGMARHWTTARGEIADFMNAVPKIVVSTTLASADWSNSRLVRSDPEGELARLKREAGNDLYIFGSAELSSTLMRAGLIDEYRLCLVSVVLGAGNPLFKPGHGVNMRLTDAKALGNARGVVLRYRPEAPASSA